MISSQKKKTLCAEWAPSARRTIRDAVADRALADSQSGPGCSGWVLGGASNASSRQPAEPEASVPGRDQSIDTAHWRVQVGGR